MRLGLGDHRELQWPRIDRFLLRFFLVDILDQLILIEGEVLDVLSRLARTANVDASLVILHLLFRFKSLFAFNCRAFELVLVMY